jgi:hypothetical protein
MRIQGVFMRWPLSIVGEGLRPARLAPRLGPWKRRIDHHGDGTSVRQQIAYQFKPLRCHLGRQQAYTGQIRSRPAEALDETARDRVRAAGKDDGDGGGGLFRGVRRDGTTGHDHGDLT